MSARELRFEWESLLADIRAAGRNAPSGARNEQIDGGILAIVCAGDDFASHALATEADERILTAFVDHVRGQAHASQGPLGIAGSRWSMSLPSWRPWAYGIAATAVLILLVSFFTARWSEMERFIVEPGPAPRTYSPGLPVPTPKPDAPLVSKEHDTQAEVLPPYRRGAKEDGPLVHRGAPAGTLGAVMGEPRVYTATTITPIIGTPGMTLARGSRIETGDADKAELRFADGTQIRLDFNSSVEIPEGKAAPRPDEIRLKSGRVYAMVAHLEAAEAFRVETAAATAEVLGTEFWLKVERAVGGTKATLQVKQGRVRFYNGFGEETATDQTESWATEKSKPTEPKRVDVHRIVFISPNTTESVGPPNTDLGRKAATLVYPKSTGGVSATQTPDGQVFAAVVYPTYPAHRAGVRTGDRIVALDGKPVRSRMEVREVLWERAGRKVAMTVERNGELSVHTLVTEPHHQGVPDLPASLERRLASASRPLLYNEAEKALSGLKQLLSRVPHPAVHNNLGVGFQVLDQMGPSIRHFREAVRLEPKEWLYRRNLGQALHLIGNYDRAMEEYRTALRLRPGQVDCVTQLANTFVSQNRAREALDVLAQAKPKDIEGELILLDAKSDILRYLGRYVEAEDAERDRLRIDPDNHDAAEHLSTILGFEGRFPEAVEAARTAVRLDPACPSARNQLGLALWQSGALREAEAAFRREIVLRPGSNGGSNLAQLLMDMGRFDEAVQIAREMVSWGSEEGHALMVRTLGRIGRLAEAEKAFAEGSRTFPKSGDLVHNMAVIYATNGKLAQGEELFRRAAALDPGRFDSRLSHAKTLLDLGKLPEAEKVARALVADFPQFELSFSALLETLAKSNREADMEAFYRDALKSGEKTPALYKSYIRMLIRQKRRPEAEALARRQPDLYRDGEATLLLVVVRQAQGKLAEAEEACRAFLKQNPGQVRITNQLVYVLIERNALDEALSLAIANVRASHDNPDYIDSLGDVYEARKELGQAERTFLRAAVGYGTRTEGERAWTKLADFRANRFAPMTKLDTYRQALRHYPMAEFLRWWLVEEADRQSQTSESLDVLREGLSLHPSELGYVRRCAQYLVWRSPEEALGLAEQCLRADPSDVEAKLHKGAALVHLARLAEAEPILSAIETMPAGLAGWVQRDARFNLGLLHEKRRELSKAADAFRRALSFEPNAVWVLEALKRVENRPPLTPEQERDKWLEAGRQLDQEGKFQDAKEAFAKAMAADPQAGWVLSSFCAVCYKLGQTQEAEDAWRKALERFPNHPKVVGSVAWLLIEQGVHLDVALRLAQRAVDLAPADMNGLANVGWAHYKRGEFAQAEEHLVKSLVGTDWGRKNDEGQAMTWAILGIVYERRSNNAKAIEAYRAALMLDPQETRAVEGLKRLGLPPPR